MQQQQRKGKDAKHPKTIATPPKHPVQQRNATLLWSVLSTQSC